MLQNAHNQAAQHAVPDTVDDLVYLLKWRCRTQLAYLATCVSKIDEPLVRLPLEEPLDALATVLDHAPYDAATARGVTRDVVDEVLRMGRDGALNDLDARILYLAALRLEDLTITLLYIGHEMELHPNRVLH